MKTDRGQTALDDNPASEARAGAPGKRPMTAGMAPVQQRSLTAAPPPVQMHAIDTSAADDPYSLHLAAAHGTSGPAEKLPHLDAIQRSFGPDHDVSGVKAHVGGAAAEATRSMGASAYATGDHVAFGATPDLHTAAHEAAHVVQQAQGVSLYGGVGEPGDRYEQHADAVADRVVAGESAADLLGGASTGGAVSSGAVQQKKDQRIKKIGKGYAKYGGGSVKAHLTKLVEAGQLALTGKQIAILDAMAQVETGGQIGCVQTYDDQIMSIGFKQVVLGHGSLAKMMKAAPKGFAKHGLALDTSRTYQHKGWKKSPPAIQGVEDEEELRGAEWAEKFYEASMEPDVVKAMCELALGELGQVEKMIEKRAGGIDHFQDATALSWLLECKNNRPAFTPKAIRRAVDSGAKSAGSRDEFLDILAKAIVTTYEIEEPILHYNKAKAERKKGKSGTISADEDAALLAKMKATYTSIGHKKGTNIVTKISRKLGVPDVAPTAAKKPAEPEAQASEAPAPAVSTAKPADEILMSFPELDPEVEAQACLPAEEHGPLQSFPEENMSVAPPAPEPTSQATTEATIAATIAVTPEATPDLAKPPPAPAPTPEPAPAPAKAEPDWSKEARAYHRTHPEYVQQFNAATQNACVGPDGELVPNDVARWQVAHGVKPDGYCGPVTVAAAVGNPPPPDAVAQVPPPPPPVLEAPTVQGPSIAANVPAAPPPTPAPSPNAAPDVLAPAAPKIEPKPAEVAKEAPKAEGEVAQAPAPAPVPAKGQPTRLVVKGGSQSCLVFISPDGVTSKPDLFIFFHGYQADYGKDVDSKQKRPGKMKLYKSGADVAEEAMAYATGKNLIAILPQGNIGRKDERGGHMKALEGGLAPFVTSVLANIAKELGVPALEAGNIGLAGHSAGGYEGIHQAMGSDKKMGDLADNITDVTLMDSAYGGVHFEDARDWIFGGPPGKNLRIIGQAVQMTKNRKGGHRPYFAFDALARYADKRGFTVKELPEGEKRDTSTVIQHTQIINPEGAVQGDVLVLMSSRKGDPGHHDIRDDVMDDAILSIGEGAAGNASFDQDRTSGVPVPAQAPAQAPAPKADEHGLAQQGQPQAEASDDADDGGGNPVPTPQHVDGADEGSKEPVQAPSIPEVQPPPAPKPEGRGNLEFPSGTKVADRLYGPEGVAAVEKLHRDSTVKVKGKDVHIHLDDEQWAFKQRCYAACVARLGDQLYGGVSPGELTNVSSGKMRHKAAAQLENMIAAFKSDPNRPPDEDLKPGSAYRPPEEDFKLWDMGFNNIYLWKIIKWAKKHSPKDPWGDKVLKKAVQIIGERKAPPGGSNHSNGTAIDLKLKYKGTWRGNKFEDQAAWKASYAYKWLLEHGKDYQFKNYSKECWHYDYKGPH